MKKAVIIVASLIIIAVISCGVIVVHAYLTRPEIGTEDRMNPWGEQYLYTDAMKRVEGWKRVVHMPEPVITKEEMGMIDGSTATVPIKAELFRQFYDDTDDAIYVSHSKTHEAYLNLINKKSQYIYKRVIDFILVTPPSKDELAYAESMGVELDITPVARDGFVFITHKNNPVDSLTIAQVQDIYTGKITNWSELGGEDLPITAYQREKNSGSQTAMEQTVMKGAKMIDPVNAMVHGMSGLVERVAEYNNDTRSIGYTYYYYLNNLYRNENIKALKIEGFSPDNENLISEKYPFTVSYMAVIRSDEPENSPARRLRDFFLTEAGQQTVEMAGYCRAQ